MSHGLEVTLWLQLVNAILHPSFPKPAHRLKGQDFNFL